MTTKKKYTGRNKRQSGCRGLVVQIKGAAYNFEVRYQEMVNIYLKKRVQHSRSTSSSLREERYLNLFKGENQYRAYDRAKQTDAADVRTMKSFLRIMGAIDDEDVVTNRGKEIVNGMTLLEFLQKYIVRVKIISPQSKRKINFKKGHKQTSFGSYRLRLFLMILYAAKKAEENFVHCEIDDIGLTACRFWPLSETENLITETMVLKRIDNHFKEKAKGNFDYRSAYENELSYAMEDSECASITLSEKARKYRNTADLVNNYFRLLKTIGLIEVVPVDPQNIGHWSLSDFSDHKTGVVPPRKINLTESGINIINSTLPKYPIWFVDIYNYYEGKESEKINQTLYVVNQIAKGKKIDTDWPEHSFKFLCAHGVLKSDGNKFIKQCDIDFDWAYDMHTTGPKVKKIFGE